LAGLEYGIATEADVEPLAAVLSQSFHFPLETARKFVERAADQTRVVRRGGEIVAGLVIHDMGQWYGGREIPMGGIAAVGVAPHVRGTGVGAVLMAETVRDLRGRGVPLSTLWASTQALYRKVGYEQAGTFCLYEVPTRALPRFPSDLPVHPIDPVEDRDLLKSIAARAPKPTGAVRRDDLLWSHLTNPEKERIFPYVVGPIDTPEGYVLLFQMDGEDGYVVFPRDLVALTQAARERIWTLISDHRSIGRTTRFRGGATSEHLLLFPEQEVKVSYSERWMLRITDVPAALAARGYPAHFEGEIHFEVEDGTVPENAGRWVLTIAGGRGEVEPGGEGSIRLDVLTLAPLFSGLYPATTLARLGRLSADERSLAKADEAMAGEEPVMVERF
jgi:predicted acetyltransferase